MLVIFLLYEEKKQRSRIRALKRDNSEVFSVLREWIDERIREFFGVTKEVDERTDENVLQRVPSMKKWIMIELIRRSIWESVRTVA